MAKEDKFIIYATRKNEQFRPIVVPVDTYDVLQQIKEETRLPLSTIAEMAIEYALERVEIRQPDQKEEA